MEMTLSLPRNYVEIEKEEMMYLDGKLKLTEIGGEHLLDLLNQIVVIYHT